MEEKPLHFDHYAALATDTDETRDREREKNRLTGREVKKKELSFINRI